MFYIVDLETRSVLTHRDGARISYGSEDLAKNHAVTAQEMTAHPHAVVHMMTNTSALRRAPAPWLWPEA